MEAMNVLDKVTEAIERVLKSTPTARTAAMTPDELVAYAVAQIEKAASEEPTRAERRLRALGKAVATAKQAFVDSASETIEVEVYEDETTAAADASEKETSLVAAGTALGSSAFAQNAEDLNKALARVAKELSALRGDRPAPQDTPSKVDKAEDVAWPLDMNTSEFRDGVKKAEGKPAWGDDPAGVRAREA
jgi:hypothetical protein